MKARDIMTRSVVTVTPDTTISDFCKILHEHDLTGLPVVDQEGNLCGIVSATDVVRANVMSETTDPDHVDIFEILSAYHHPFERPGESGPHHYNWVEEIMNSNVKTVTPDIDVTEVAKIIHRNHYHRIPVVEGKKVVGMISTIDLVGILARQEPWTSR